MTATPIGTEPHLAPAVVPEPAGSLQDQRREPLALALLVSAQFLVMLDTSIVNVALPSIQSELGFGPAQVTWVVNAYVLAFAGLLLLSGRASDLFGRRRLFTTGAGLFTLGTLLAALAAGPVMLIGGRVIQGIGAAALSPAAMSLLLVTFPAEQRARAMGAWGAASTLGGATGVVTGGLLVGGVGWRAVFLVTVPVSGAAVVLARRILAADTVTGRRSLDWVGAALATGAVITLVHGAVDAVDHGWTSPRVLGLLATSVALGAAFVAVERRVVDPLVPPDLFGSRMTRAGVVLALLGGTTRGSTFVLTALYLQQVLAMSPQQAGIAMVPTSLTGFVVSLGVLPRALRAFGPLRTLVVGLVLLAGGQLWLAYSPQDLGYLSAVLPGLLLVATGVALSFTPTTMVLAAAVPASHTGLASGLASASMQVGGALGTAAFIVIGASAGQQATGALAGSGFTAAFTAGAGVALATAALGWRALSAGRAGARPGKGVL
jgi:EmrB/QacA subfamily drug resistance transporter